ncbi:hypothetical protein C723_2036 [Christiangramia flava JLT2011]|uniref:Uncharacterized protein n=1 Tax=Christiangramia flava JLT2011 TaxID=1229726 RepID=A0A1L7I6S9_9FLAO|nr:hypothetical protein GRFL_2101 [Christiangramia flava JLT2011]OSS39030.1 hypothetical protein C723_2036 [Christiangramia flava JLT2011]
MLTLYIFFQAQHAFYPLRHPEPASGSFKKLKQVRLDEA